MGFRTLEIGQEAELHIKEGQLEVTTKDGKAYVAIEDLSMIMLHGANIRLSSMDLSILTRSKVGILTLDEKYLPTAMVLPFEGHARQSKLMHRQVQTLEEKNMELWIQIVRQKIRNQAGTLSIHGKNGAESVGALVEQVTEESVNQMEAQAAREYFEYYHEGLNRRTDDPVNSRLNYGYAVVRSTIARSLVTSGFHPTFGIHHDSQLNAFNLADDLIEPFRAMVDLTAYENMGSNIILNKNERRAMAGVLHHACKIGDTKVTILSAIDIMVDSLKRIILADAKEELKLPRILPLERMEGITE